MSSPIEYRLILKNLDSKDVIKSTSKENIERYLEYVKQYERDRNTDLEGISYTLEKREGDKVEMLEEHIGTGFYMRQIYNMGITKHDSE